MEKSIRESVPSFKSLLKSFQAPILSLIILMLSNGFFITYISVRLEVAGHSPSEIGLVHSMFYFGLLVGATRIEKLILRIGHIRTFATFTSLYTACVLGQSLYVDVYLWMGLRWIAGLSLAALYITIESWLLSNSPSASRGKVLSVYMFALYLTQALSQFLINFFEIESYTPYVVAAIICSFSSIPLTFTYTKPPSISEPSTLSLRKTFTQSPFGFLGCFISGIVISAIYSLVPTYAIEYHIPVALLLSITITGGVLLQWPIGHLSDIFDRGKTLLMVSICSMVPSILMGIFYDNITLVYITGFFLGGFAFVLYPLGIAQVCDRLQANDITQAAGVLLISYGLGAVFGPIYSSAIMDFFGTPSLFFSMALASLALSAIGFFSVFFKPKVPSKDQSEYVSLPRTTSVAYELDPRANNEDSEEDKDKASS